MTTNDSIIGSTNREQEVIGQSLDSEPSIVGKKTFDIAIIATELEQSIELLQVELQVAIQKLNEVKKSGSNGIQINSNELDQLANSDNDENPEQKSLSTKKKKKKNKKKTVEENNKTDDASAGDTDYTIGNASIVVSNTYIPTLLASQLNTTSTIVSPPATKRGYLFKWLDRSIGWGGTKWALRFVVLEKGKLAYYGSHNDTAPRYVLSLKGCAVKNDGYKHNRRYVPKTKDKMKQNGKTLSKKVNSIDESVDPPLEEPGAYFFLFAIYQRNEDDEDDDDEDEENVVPLLRFSTPSMAERHMWMQGIEESCAYCDTDEYMIQEAQRAAEIDKQVQDQQQMTMAMPEAKEGTLPPLFFAPPTTNVTKSTLHRSRPSFSRIPSKLNIKRSHSRNFDSDKKDAKSTKGYPPSKPMHRCNGPSYLSFGEAPPIQNYRGFFNLGIIILIVSNMRLIFVSIKNHGFIIQPKKITMYLYHLPTAIMNHPDRWSEFPFVIGCLLQILFVLITYVIEDLLGTNRIKSETLGMTLHHINSHGSIIITIWIVWNYIPRPVVGSILLMQGTITWMKSISYFLCNQDYRLSTIATSGSIQRRKSFVNDTFNNDTTTADNPAVTMLILVEDLDDTDRTVTYPDNVTLSNIIYFWCCPSLTYQIAFPKSRRIRPWVVLDILMKMIITISLFMFVAMQIVAPALNSLVNDLIESNGVYTNHLLMEYWLRLSIANTYLWLIFFYLYFHLFLNLLSEVLRFGDRVFYKDWWNSAEVSAFWRLWNL